MHELTGHPVLVAFNASNLGKVAELYRARHPERAIYIAGDSDREKVPNVGRIKAEEAAAAIGGRALFPLFPDGVKGTDWNDLAKAVGRETAQIWHNARCVSQTVRWKRPRAQRQRLSGRHDSGRLARRLSWSGRRTACGLFGNWLRCSWRAWSSS